MSKTHAAPSAASMDAHATVEKRFLSRKKAFHPATLVTEQGYERLHLLNISTLGALGYMFNPPSAGEVRRLTLLDHEVDAEIIWQDDRKFGMSFNSPISAELVDRLLAIG